MVSAAKKRIDQFPTTVKESSVQIRQYQEIVSELIGIFKEHNFLHGLSSQVPVALFLNFLHDIAADWPSLLKENQDCQPGIHLQIG